MRTALALALVLAPAFAQAGTPINETRPLSATKRWRLVEILEKAK